MSIFSSDLNEWAAIANTEREKLGIAGLVVAYDGDKVYTFAAPEGFPNGARVFPKMVRYQHKVMRSEDVDPIGAAHDIMRGLFQLYHNPNNVGYTAVILEMPSVIETATEYQITVPVSYSVFTKPS